MVYKTLYELYDTFPAGKGSSRRTQELLNPNNHSIDIDFTLVCKYKNQISTNKKGPISTTNYIHIEKNINGTYSPIKEGLQYRRKFSQIDTSNYDILHTRSPWAGVPVGNIKEEHNFKFVYECNGLPSLELAYTHPKFAKSHKKDLRKLAQNEVYTALKADAIVVVSEVTKRYLVDHGINENKIRIIPNGVDPNIFTSEAISSVRKHQLFDSKLHPYSEDNILLGYIGAFQPWQGIISLVEILDILISEFPKLKLVLAGKAKRSWRKHLRNITKEKGIRDHLIMLKETKTLRNIPELINAFDICIAPLERTSRNELMGANPIKLYEYAACNKPIIVSDLSIVREILPEEVCHYVPPPDMDHFPQILVEKIRESLAHNLNPRKVVLDKTWKVRGKQMDELYLELLE